MFAWLRRPATWMVLLLLALPLLAGCSPDANAMILSPQLGEREMQIQEMGAVVAIPTAVPRTLNDFPGDAATAGLDESIAAAFANADPQSGRTLYQTQGCAGCHAIEPGIEMTGPTWVNLGNTAAHRTTATGDASPALYIYNSIAYPNEYVVAPYDSGVMLQTYLETLSEQDFADLIAFILSQNTN